MAKSLVVVEVSQKQAYIFSSNKLRDNISRSAVIAYVTGSEYFKKAAADHYDEEKNEVYSGGGHSILQFANREQARSFIRAITLDARVRFPGLELFATIYDCKSEPTAEDISSLMQKLERKKSIRRASFSQGSFGVEEMDSSTRAVTEPKINGRKVVLPSLENDGDVYPQGFAKAWEFENLGASRNESSFIAVVHVDGNAMGKRVEQIRKDGQKQSWEEYCGTLKRFSESIDEDFKGAFAQLCAVVAGNIHDGKLDDIELKMAPNGDYYFPIRRVITEGDDICFVTEGRIGIECARIFMEILAGKKNRVDQKSYAAAAGVMIVHNKYPFYIAYRHAEMLCSNAKKYIANATQNASDADASNVSAIDWHIDFGEPEDGIDEIREKYRTADGKHMELRPYVVSGPAAFLERERARNYRNFRTIVCSLEKVTFARGKIKQLRDYIRQGETAVQNYLRANLIEDLVLQCYQGIYADADLSLIGTGQKQQRKTFIETTDGEQRSVLFDAIELMDTFIALSYTKEEG
ncbi:MAG: hypothetical protein LUH14_10775 [Clostridiaceae bacterium]|nr:hypothetical protein [Clostridiaceae bacterium]